MNKKLRVGTRSSRLATAQTNHATLMLQEFHKQLSIEIVRVVTRGDKNLKPFVQIGGKGLFTEELERQIRSGTIDCAVHSLKDLPVDLPEGLVIAAVPLRNDAHDMLVCTDPGIHGIEGLPAGARIGTSSLRRKAQLLQSRPDVTIVELRGNLDTRLKKLKQGLADAIVVAAAGLYRLFGPALSEHDDTLVYRTVPFESMLPAPGQGAIAFETRADDHELIELLAALNDVQTALTTRAERSLLSALGGGCQVPLGARGEIQEERLVLESMVTLPDGSKSLRDSEYGHPAECEEIGVRLAQKLISQGAEEIIAESTRK